MYLARNLGRNCKRSYRLRVCRKYMADNKIGNTRTSRCWTTRSGPRSGGTRRKDLSSGRMVRFWRRGKAGRLPLHQLLNPAQRLPPRQLQLQAYPHQLGRQRPKPPLSDRSQSTLYDPFRTIVAFKHYVAVSRPLHLVTLMHVHHVREAESYKRQLDLFRLTWLSLSYTSKAIPSFAWQPIVVEMFRKIERVRIRRVVVVSVVRESGSEDRKKQYYIRVSR